MNRIAFKSVFLASPIAFVGGPAIASFSPHMAEATSVSVKFQAAEGAPENHRSYVVVDVPIYMRPEVNNPFQNIIADEGKHPLATQSGQTIWKPSSPDSAAIETAAYSTGAQSNPEQNGSLIDAVIEDHSRRIEFLKQRIEAIRLSGGDPLTISGLKVRLKRAEAARSVALARRDIDGLDVVNSEIERNATRVVAIVSMHLPVVETRRNSTRGHVVEAAHLRPPTASSFSAASLHARERARSSTKHLGSATLLLASAKRSLAYARNQLAQISDEAPNAFDRNGTTVAGLLRWPGSEAWSLPAQRA